MTPPSYRRHGFADGWVRTAVMQHERPASRLVRLSDNRMPPCVLAPLPISFSGSTFGPPRSKVKSGIHPEYATATVKCACGASWQTRSTVGELHLDICSACHPFYTGKQKLVDTAGRVERFRQKYAAGKKTT